MRELRSKLSVAWRCAPAGQKLLAAGVLLVLLGGIVVAVRGGSSSTQAPVVRAAATVEQPAPVAQAQPAVSPESSPLPTTVPPTTSAPSPKASVTVSSAAPASGPDLETASAPDSAAAQACTTYRTAVEPIIRQAVDNDDLEPATALIRAGSDPRSPWAQLTSAVTVAAMRAPSLQQHVTALGRDISEADPSLSLMGLGSDLDAIDMDCGDAPG